MGTGGPERGECLGATAAPPERALGPGTAPHGRPGAERRPLCFRVAGRHRALRSSGGRAALLRDGVAIPTEGGGGGTAACGTRGGTARPGLRGEPGGLAGRGGAARSRLLSLD